MMRIKSAFSRPRFCVYAFIKNMLLFWLRNKSLIQKGLLPVTNPMWLQNQEGCVVKLMLFPEFIDGRSFPGRTIAVRISSKQDISRDDFEKKILWFMDNYNWVGLSLGMLWKIVCPSEDMVIDSDNWRAIEFKHPF